MGWLHGWLISNEEASPNIVRKNERGVSQWGIAGKNNVRYNRVTLMK
jgi:hypothetical protein